MKRFSRIVVILILVALLPHGAALPEEPPCVRPRTGEPAIDPIVADATDFYLPCMYRPWTPPPLVSAAAASCPRVEQVGWGLYDHFASTVEESTTCVGVLGAKDFALGDSDICVLLTGGLVNCERWSYGTGDAIAVAIGGLYPAAYCVLTVAQNVNCDDPLGRAPDRFLGDAVAVSAHDRQVCILLESGNVDCTLIRGTSRGEDADWSTGNIVGLDTGWESTCVLHATGRVSCSGFITRYPADPVDDAIAISVAHANACALRVGGFVHCWGDTRWPHVIDDVRGDAVRVATSEGHTCILRTIGSIDCVANNAYEPVAYTGGDAVDLKLDSGTLCVLLRSGSVECDGGSAREYVALTPPV